MKIPAQDTRIICIRKEKAASSKIHMPDDKDNNANLSTLETGGDTLKSIMNSVPAVDDDSSDYLIKMEMVRDVAFSQIPAASQTGAVKALWRELWAKSMLMLTPEQLMSLKEAFTFSALAHDGQLRKSGEPYIIHTLSTALILAGMRFDLATLQAALLHDTLEDTSTKPDEIADRFGPDVLTLVQGVTKLAGEDVKRFMSREDLTSENLRRMFVVMAKDIRVVLIKLADRLHNMRTLDVMRPDKQVRIARETMEIYAPLAHRLGIYQIKRELEDLSFRYLQPDVYYEVERRVKQRMPKMEEVINKAREVLEARLAKENIPCRIKGRSKHYYGIYEKMQRKKLSFEELYDILAVRVLVSDVSTCYAVLGIVHALWVPVPGQFDDYIATPKSNMYQSLHTTVMAFGVPLEVQIRTYEMNNLAEYGIAAHWVYKAGGSRKLIKGLDAKLMWVRQALEAGGDEGGSSHEFMDVLKSDILLTSEVYVFTPDGKPLILPNGSTTIDFAYSVHTEIGNHCVGAMINGRIVPLNTQLHSGDMVKILTSPQGSPSKDWIKIVNSAKTRAKIRSYFKQAEKADRDEKLDRGWKLIERELRKRGLEGVTRSDFNNIDDQLISVGSGSAGPAAVAQQLALAYVQHHAPEQQKMPVNLEPAKESKKFFKSDILVEGEGGVSVTLANCCEPVPGDDIIGISTIRRGITIHRADCQSISGRSDDQIIHVSWANDDKSIIPGRDTKYYKARLKVEGVDREELLADAAKAVGLEGISIISVKAGVVGNSLMRMKLELRVRNLEHLYSAMARLNEVRGIMEVTRG